MQNQFNTIAAYRYEMNMKTALMEKIEAEYPEMLGYQQFNPLRDVHNFTFIELNFKLQNLISHAKVNRAAKRIQDYWRSKKTALLAWALLKQKMAAARKI